MKRLAVVIWSVFCVALAITGAYYLTALYLTMPTDMPYWVDMAIRFGFSFFLNNNMPDPDDMGVIALLIYFSISMAISGAMIGVVGIFLWRRTISFFLR
ncbi:hypothetical protein [Paraburkholderia tagetis]|uniref:Uncharacterized protein n=1 Tax=Paraburkholderia tagetis TaxID=2913261 RepID=A0A9X1UFH0_9BURK|nr:hypothetical protein [Paraburkholderia tagetis]MCG5071918.1 hypothetical protein [Paraburkholderia tagetis]